MMNTILIITLFLLSVGTQAELSLQQITEYLHQTMVLLTRLNETVNEKSCSTTKASSCAELFLEGNVKSGIYNIYPKPWFSKNSIQVYCDMDTDGGGWTVFQRREDFEITENFFRDWSDYRRGFGEVQRDYWLALFKNLIE